MDAPRRPPDWARINGSRIPEHILAAIQDIDDRAFRDTDQSGGAAGDAIANPGMGMDLTPPSLRSIWVIITDQISESQALYSFAQIVTDLDEAITVEGGLTGEFNLLEVNHNTGVPIGTVVVAWPSEDNSGENWRFEYCCGNAVATLGENIWTTDQDDWVPPDGAGTVLIESTLPVDLNGIELTENQTITLVNVGDYPITIVQDAPSSLEENWFDTTVIVGPADVITIWNNPVNGQNTIISTTGTIIHPVQTIAPDGPIDDLVIDPGTEDVFFVLDEDQPLNSIQGGVDGQVVTITVSPGSTGSLTLHPGVSTPDGIPWIVRPGTSQDIVFEDGEWTVLQPSGPQSYTPSISGSNNNLPVPTGVGYLSPVITGATTITGIAVTGTNFLVITNPATNTDALTLAHEDADSLEENQFSIFEAEDVVLDPGEVSFWVLDPVDEIGWLYAGGTPQAGGGGGIGTGTEETLAAAGNSQGTAAQITADNVRATGGDGTNGVILPDVAGARIIVWNDTEIPNTLEVYPPSGANFSSGSTNQALTMDAGEIAIYCRISSTVWTHLDMIGFP